MNDDLVKTTFDIGLIHQLYIKYLHLDYV